MKRRDLLRHLSVHGCALLHTAAHCCVKEVAIPGGKTLNLAPAAPFLATARSATCWRERSVVIWVFPNRSASNQLLHRSPDAVRMRTRASAAGAGERKR